MRNSSHKQQHQRKARKQQKPQSQSTRRNSQSIPQQSPSLPSQHQSPSLNSKIQSRPSSAASTTSQSSQHASISQYSTPTHHHTHLSSLIPSRTSRLVHKATNSTPSQPNFPLSPLSTILPSLLSSLPRPFSSFAPARGFKRRPARPSSAAQSPEQTEDGNADGSAESQASFFFNEKPDENYDLEQRMKVRSFDRKIGLDAVKGFLGTDPTQSGMSRQQQTQFAEQFLGEMQAQQDLRDVDEYDLQPELSPDEYVKQQFQQFDDMPLEEYLKDTGHYQPKEMLKSLDQRNRAQRRFRLQTEGLTGLYSQTQNDDENQGGVPKRPLQPLGDHNEEDQEALDNGKPAPEPQKYELNEEMISRLEALSPHDLKLLLDPTSPIYDPILHNTLSLFHDQVEELESKTSPTSSSKSKSKPSKKFQVEEHSLGHDDDHDDFQHFDDGDADGDDYEDVPDVASISQQFGDSGLKPQVGQHGELIFDENNFHDEDQLLAFQEHQQTLAQDPTVFRYFDDEFEHFIPPGMSIQKLVKMNVPPHEILNYTRKQIADGQINSSYVGVSLQQMNLKFQLENQKRLEAGLEPIVLREFKPTRFKDLDLTGIADSDVRDLQQYYSHFDRLRRLKKFEKMKDNPSFDPNDPDWQDDADDYEVDEDGILHSTKISKSLMKKKKLLLQQQNQERDQRMAEMAAANGLTVEEFKAQQKFLDDQGFSEDPDAVDPDDWALLDKARKAKMVGKQLISREAQYPDHKPTIKALQSFVRTVPLDEPIPRELQRRLNMLLTDADYVKRKDYHFMMNDVEVWYLANRLPVVYSIMRRVLVEIRQRIPAWKPERVLEFAAGASPGLWAARDVYYQDIGEYTAVERDGRLALLGQQLTADLGIHIYYRSRLLVNSDGQMEISHEDELKREKKRSKLTHKQKKIMDKEDKERKSRHLQEMAKKHSLVFSPYALSKQPNKEYRRLLLESLWDQVDPNGGLLVILESTEADSSGFNVVRECRDYLLKKYPKQVKIQSEESSPSSAAVAAAQSGNRVVDDEAKQRLVTPIVHVEESLKATPTTDATADGSAKGGDSSVPAWAQGATKKVQTEEAKRRQAAPEQPSASSILPCSHDRPCPMGAMLKLNDEVKKLKKLASEEQLSISLPQVTNFSLFLFMFAFFLELSNALTG